LYSDIELFGLSDFGFLASLLLRILTFAMASSLIPGGQARGDCATDRLDSPSPPASAGEAVDRGQIAHRRSSAAQFLS
jgi:hypothetical protein